MKWVLWMFAALYGAAFLLFLIGTYGWFGQEKGPLAGVFLIPLGLPWNLLADRPRSVSPARCPFQAFRGRLAEGLPVRSCKASHVTDADSRRDGRHIVLGACTSEAAVRCCEPTLCNEPHR